MKLLSLEHIAKTKEAQKQNTNKLRAIRVGVFTSQCLKSKGLALPNCIGLEGGSNKNCNLNFFVLQFPVINGIFCERDLR